MNLKGCGHDSTSQGIQKECPCKRIPMFFSLPTAAMFGDFESCRAYLIRRGNKTVNLSDSYGYTPLHMAAQNNHKEIVELLLQHGSLVDGPTNPPSKCTPLLRAAHSGALEACGILIGAGADVERSDTSFGDEKTPLLKACSSGNNEVVALLLENRASLQARDSNGDGPLELTREYPSVNMLLREMGALPSGSCQVEPTSGNHTTGQAGTISPTPAKPTEPQSKIKASDSAGATSVNSKESASFGLSCPICASPMLTALRSKCCSRLVCKNCRRTAVSTEGLCSACPRRTS